MNIPTHTHTHTIIIYFFSQWKNKRKKKNDNFSPWNNAHMGNCFLFCTVRDKAFKFKVSTAMLRDRLLFTFSHFSFFDILGFTSILDGIKTVSIGDSLLSNNSGWEIPYYTRTMKTYKMSIRSNQIVAHVEWEFKLCANVPIHANCKKKDSTYHLSWFTFIAGFEKNFGIKFPERYFVVQKMLQKKEIL